MREPNARYEITTRDDPGAVRRVVDPNGILAERLMIAAKRPDEMPDAVRGHNVSVMFYAGGETWELGRSPTRMGEVLGCGLPVIANDGVGDVARIVNEHRVGVLAPSSSQTDMAAALDALDHLMSDPGLPAMCRRAAETVFSLGGGIAAFDRLYRRVLGQYHHV